MNKAAKATLWCAIQAAYWLVLVYAMRDVRWCWNLFRFSAWLFTGIYLLGYFQARDGCSDVIKAAVRSVPGWLSLVSDLGMTLLLAAYGHFGYAVLMFAQQICEASFFSAAEKSRESAK